MEGIRNVKIPIIIGVTGHRDISDDDLPKLKELVRQELTKLIEAYPHSEFIMLNSLAAGADSICAEIGLELGMRLVCALPLEEGDYCYDFLPSEYRTFKYLVGQSDECFVVENRFHIFSREMIREDHYRSASHFVATSSFALLAIWDGIPAKKDSCGTSKAVEYMQESMYMGKYPWIRNRRNGSVIHIQFPRAISFNRPEIGVRLIENEPGCQHELFSYIDGLNARLETDENIVRILKPGRMTDTHYDIYLSDNNDFIDHIIDNIRDADVLRKSLPGVRTYRKIMRIAKLEQKPEIAIIEECPDKIIPAIQEQAYPNSRDILEILYLAKYGVLFNTEQEIKDSLGRRGRRVKSKLEIENQIRRKDPDEAFKGITPEDIRKLEIDLRNDTSLDEFAYIDAENKNDWLEDRISDYEKWRFNRLCTENLIKE